MDMVHISFIERIWLGSFFGLLCWALIGIMALVLALVAKHLADIPLVLGIWAVLSIVMIMANMSISLVVSIASLESTMIMMLVVASSTMVVPMFMTMIHIMSEVLLE